MKISIEFCGMWNYEPQAASLAAMIMDSFGVEAELIRGSNGVFDVKVDDELIFSKDEAGHFPDESAVIAMIKERQS